MDWLDYGVKGQELCDLKITAAALGQCVLWGEKNVHQDLVTASCSWLKVRGHSDFTYHGFDIVNATF